MQEVIDILVARDGKVTISTKGFKGKACKLATKPLEEALGVVTSDQPTAEMYQTEQQQVKAHG